MQRVVYVILLLCAAGLSVADPPPEKLPITGISNFSIIDDSSSFAGVRIGFGGATEPSAMQLLSNQGFVTVVNLRVDTEDGANIPANRTAANSAGLNYIHLPLNPEAPGDMVDRFLAVAAAEDNQPIYVHCGSGTRAAAVWMIGRVLLDGLNEETAAHETMKIAEKPDEAVSFASKYIASQPIPAP